MSKILFVAVISAIASGLRFGLGGNLKPVPTIRNIMLRRQVMSVPLMEVVENRVEVHLNRKIGEVMATIQAIGSDMRNKFAQMDEKFEQKFFQMGEKFEQKFFQVEQKFFQGDQKLAQLEQKQSELLMAAIGLKLMCGCVGAIAVSLITAYFANLSVWITNNKLPTAMGFFVLLTLVFFPSMESKI